MCVGASILTSLCMPHVSGADGRKSRCLIKGVLWVNVSGDHVSGTRMEAWYQVS